MPQTQQQHQFDDMAPLVPPGTGRVVFVRNLPYDARAEDIIAPFVSFQPAK